jgi:glycosyltransferase involved in cell wall biosynthesis
MAAKDSLFSVIVPAYCEEQNIERCLQSIQRQAFEKGRIETIVVDSNSPDNTRTIAQKYADKVVNLKDRGVSKARNLGAQKATGELLIFVDADTILDPEFIAEIHDALNHSNAVYVAGTMAGLEWYGTASNLFKFLHYGLVNLISTLTAHLGFPFFPTVCCACKKSAFHRVGGFDEGLAIAEDMTFSLKMGKIGKCLVSKKAKAYTSLRRIQKNGVMKNYYMYFSNYFKVFILNKKPWITDFPHPSEI